MHAFSSTLLVHDPTTQPQLCWDLNHVCYDQHHASSGLLRHYTKCLTAQNVHCFDQQGRTP